MDHSEAAQNLIAKYVPDYTLFVIDNVAAYVLSRDGNRTLSILEELGIDIPSDMMFGACDTMKHRVIISTESITSRRWKSHVLHEIAHALEAQVKTPTGDHDNNFYYFLDKLKKKERIV